MTRVTVVALTNSEPAKILGRKTRYGIIPSLPGTPHSATSGTAFSSFFCN